jgi:hypothetical protein
MQGAKRVSSLVCTVVCLRARLWRTACIKNCFVDNVACVHGGSVSDQRFALRPHSLPLHRAVFHHWRCCLAWIWAWTSAAWGVRMEMDWRHNDYWRDHAHLYPRTGSRPISAKQTRRDLTSRHSQPAGRFESNNPMSSLLKRDSNQPTDIRRYDY